MAASKNGGVIDIRKLAALDIAFLGPRFILAEFGLAVLLCPALGLLTLVRSHSVWQVILAGYLLSLGVNYVPLLAYAIAIVRRRTSQQEVADELAFRGRPAAFRRYRRQSLLLLVHSPCPPWLSLRSAKRRKNVSQVRANPCASPERQGLRGFAGRCSVAVEVHP